MSNKKKLLVILNGGTIDNTDVAGWLVIDDSTVVFKKKNGSRVDYKKLDSISRVHLHNPEDYLSNPVNTIYEACKRGSLEYIIKGERYPINFSLIEDKGSTQEDGTPVEDASGTQGEGTEE